MTKALYAGLDVSLEMTSICVVDAEGGMILDAKAVSDPADIGEVLTGTDGVFERSTLLRGRTCTSFYQFNSQPSRFRRMCRRR